MLPRIVKNKWRHQRFLAAVLLAGLGYAFLLTQVVVTMPGTIRQYQTGLTFWGSILRRQDVQPQAFSSEQEISQSLIPEPSNFPGILQAKAWQLGAMLDKPPTSRTKGFARLPPKFPTGRVEVDDVPPEAVPGIPDAPRVPLRMPRS